MAIEIVSTNKPSTLSKVPVSHVSLLPKSSSDHTLISADGVRVSFVTAKQTE